MEKIIYALVSIVLIILLSGISPYYVRFPSSHVDEDGKLIDAFALSKQADEIKGTDVKSVLLSISKYREGSGNVRLIMWENSLEILKTYWSKGIGLGNWYIHYPAWNSHHKKDHIFSYGCQPKNLHNDHFQQVLEISIWGFAVFIVLVLMVLRSCYRAFKETNDPKLKLYLMFGFMAFINFMVNSLFSFPLRMAMPPFFLSVLLGIFISLDRHVRKNKGAGRNLLPPKYYVFSFGMVVCVLICSSLLNVRLFLFDYHHTRAQIFSRYGKPAISLYELQMASAYNPFTHKIWFELGSVLRELELPNRSVKAFKKALNIHPNHINSLYETGFLYVRKGKFEKAEFYFLKLLKILPEDVLILYNMGRIKENLGSTDEAKEYYLRAVQISEEYYKAHRKLGTLYLQEREFIHARHHLEIAYTLAPGTDGVEFDLGTVYSNLAMHDKAIEFIEKGLQIQPDNANAMTNMGISYAKSGRLKDAMSAFGQAIKLDPELGEGHINMSMAYYILEDYESAMKHAKKAHEHDTPRSLDMIKLLKDKIVVSPVPSIRENSK